MSNVLDIAVPNLITWMDQFDEQVKQNLLKKLGGTEIEHILTSLASQHLTQAIELFRLLDGDRYARRVLESRLECLAK
jgi:hypothetical protein